TISLRVLYSMKEMYLAFFVSLLVAAINVALFYPMVNAIGHAGIPLAISIGLIIEGVLFVLSLKVKIRIKLKGFFNAIVKIGVASFVSVGFMYGVYLILNRVVNFGKLSLLVNFALASFVFVLVYIPTLKILKVEEVQKIIKLARKGN
ncbi:MAG: polysaccharide biosynthesis C-terminal domain-containing protein, partial [Caldisericaceae bacterium]